jgi:hypothetical protein
MSTAIIAGQRRDSCDITSQNTKQNTQLNIFMPNIYSKTDFKKRKSEAFAAGGYECVKRRNLSSKA